MKIALVVEGQIVQIESITFPVAPELNWMDVADDVTSETHQVVDGVILLKPVHVPTYSELRQACLRSTIRTTRYAIPRHNEWYRNMARPYQIS